MTLETLGDDFMVKEAEKKLNELREEIDYYEDERREMEDMNMEAKKVPLTYIVFEESDHIY